MSLNVDRSASPRFGTQTLLCLLILAIGIAGLVLLPSEVEVYSFGSGGGPDARFFPRIVLGLLVASVLIRLLLNLRQRDIPLGGPMQWLRVGVVAVGVIVGIAIMPTLGFLAGSALAGCATVLAFTERRPWVSFVLAIFVAVVVTYAARKLIGIPLP